jgi:predicted dehydrogenase
MIGTSHSHAAGKLKVFVGSPDFELVAVAEPDAAARARALKNPLYKGVRWASEDELISDSSIRAIGAEGDVWENLPRAKKIIAAGKHLHLEKPPGHEMAPFRELVEEARKKKLLCQVGYIWRNHAGINAALEAARKGWLGAVYMLRATINTDHEQPGRTPLARYKGGMMFELGCHMIDRVVDLWGRPKDVRSWIRHDMDYADALGDNTLAVFEYGRSLATVSTSARLPGSGQHRSFELLGTEGSVLIQPVEPGTTLRVVLRRAAGPYRAGAQEIALPPQVRYGADLAEFAAAIRSGRPLRHSYEHELAVQETLLRACGEQAV